MISNPVAELIASARRCLDDASTVDGALASAVAVLCDAIEQMQPTARAVVVDDVVAAAIRADERERIARLFEQEASFEHWIAKRIRGAKP